MPVRFELLFAYLLKKFLAVMGLKQLIHPMANVHQYPQLFQAIGVEAHLRTFYVILQVYNTTTVLPALAFGALTAMLVGRPPAICQSSSQGPSTALNLTIAFSATSLPIGGSPALSTGSTPWFCKYNFSFARKSGILSSQSKMVVGFLPYLFDLVDYSVMQIFISAKLNYSDILLGLVVIDPEFILFLLSPDVD
ncbi:hypothetical protein RCL_jg17320.t1 [Rhizophagus clarus]|uniref:SLC26A/SulP transporter domain-containing protein n=1 Tax=Rhizophagus clarus TaxID=94130 RepID=A0A8H3KZD1_9GLOM|nr:hypothetical protein RCL_jg17320.t1 [Rhizophagus clarus]